jgi:2-phosphosulfolactate phosphatase
VAAAVFAGKRRFRMSNLSVHYLPQFVADYELAGSTVVAVDLLRASSTICHALAAGATEVIPFVEVAETAQAAVGHSRADTLLGGERGGQRIESFDLGNSPSEYSPEIVFGRRVLFTTTNGTRALRHAHLARRVVVGAIVNLTAVAESVSTAEHLHILCAGTGGHVTREDILAAGAIVHKLLTGAVAWQLNESAERALAEWQELCVAARSAGRSLSEQLALELRDTQGGKNLLAIGHDEDLVTCSQIDALNIVPEFDLKRWLIYLP